MTGKKPEKKPFGRDGPPKGYPKDKSVYADPENWRYPLHTSWHARAARRYFDDLANRSKYTDEESAYIDSRIDEALKKFQVRTVKTEQNQAALAGRNPDELSLTDLLQIFLGPARLKRTEEIGDSMVSIVEVGAREVSGKVKDYVVKIDAKNHVIFHDCQDWRNNMESKKMCKHLGKFFLVMNQATATNLLREILSNKDKWKFTAPEQS